MRPTRARGARRRVLVYPYVAKRLGLSRGLTPMPRGAPLAILLTRPSRPLPDCSQAFQMGISQSDDEYEEFADRYPTHQIFLATDNAATQRRFTQRYGERLRVTTSISDCLNDSTEARLVERHTPLRLAVVDMFVCVEAEVFKGSPWSSFSDAIAHMRTVTGQRHAEDEHKLVDPPLDAALRA
jgi:hypothetical protein